jgi:hypothetical protein
MRQSLFLLLLLSSFPAVAGPPFVTDDPEPVEYQHFEINSAMQGSFTKDGHTGAWPTIDANYGPLPDVQFHVGLFAAVSGSHYGYGDTELGIKYRFIEEDEEGWRPQVAIYPITQFPTGSAAKGLGAGYQRTLLPVWVQKSFGDWTTYGGGGYWLNRHADLDRDYWFAGWVVTRKLSDEWTLGGEIFHQTADEVGGRENSGFNLGGYYNFDEENHLIFTFGRGLQDAGNSNRFSYYVGWQAQF